jgi:tRNA1Val (adenine37-N6)-methyltransferase
MSSRPYFEFRQFKVHHDRSALKVTTDACVFGAWTHVPPSGSVLDIGAGSGLLSLMLAQRSNARITAVEIDDSSFSQAKENFMNSPWCDRMQIFHADISDFSIQDSFDLVIANPPFYAKGYPSPTSQRNQAMREKSLSIQVLAKEITRLLHPEGYASVMYPVHEAKRFISNMKTMGWSLHQLAILHQSPEHDVLRYLMLFGKAGQPVVQTRIDISNAAGDYSPEFKQLMSVYYLHL